MLSAQLERVMLSWGAARGLIPNGAVDAGVPLYTWNHMGPIAIFPTAEPRVSGMRVSVITVAYSRFAFLLLTDDCDSLLRFLL